MKLQKEFFDIYSIENNYNKKNNIELNEDNFISDKNYLQLQNLDDEINYISYLINITNEKLLKYENNDQNNNNINNNNQKSLTLTIKDLMELIDKKNNKEKVNLIYVKSGDNLNLDFVQEDERNKNSNQKKSEENHFKTLFDDDFPNLFNFSNKLFISSKNNKPINIEKLDTKNIKFKEKEDLTNFKINNNERDIINNINFNDLINNENNDYKNDIISINQNKFFRQDINRIRKDSIISDYSNFGNLNNNIFLEQNLFNNMNNFNLMSMNKLENEVF